MQIFRFQPNSHNDINAHWYMYDPKATDVVQCVGTLAL